MAAVIGLAAAWVIVTAGQNLLAEAFRGFQDIRLAAIFGGFDGSLLSAILFALLWLIQGHSNLAQILIISLVAGSTSALVGGLLLRQKIRVLEPGDRLPHREVLAIAWPALVANVTFFVLEQAHIWVLGANRPEDDVALYGAAFRLVTLIAVPLFLVNAVVPPLIAELYARNNKRELERMLRITALLAGVPAALGLVVYVFFGEIILGIVYGSFYSQGAMVLVILSIGRLLGVLAGSCQQVLMMTGHQLTLMAGAVLSVSLSLLLSFLLVGEFGVLGVAVASASGLILHNVITLLAVRWKIGIWTYPGYPSYVLRTIRGYIGQRD
jgi:O-antigen/teichoic acid export membrane protein